MAIRWITYLILATTTFVHAQVLCDETRLTIYALNDNWGTGLVQIRDDYRSFGIAVHRQWQTPKGAWEWQSQFSGITDRGDNNHRLDEWSATISIPIAKNKDQPYQWSLIIGGLLTGNLGGQQVQNWIHEQFQVAPLTGTYSSETQFNATLGTGWRNHWWLNPSHSEALFFHSQVLWHIGFQRQWNVGIGYRIQNRSADQWTIDMGYQYQSTPDESTLTRAYDRESGLFFRSTFRAGWLFYTATVYPEKQFALGGMGIQFGSTNKNQYRNNDLSVEIGGTTGDNGFYVRGYSTISSKNQQRWSWEGHYQFWGLSRTELPTTSGLKGHFQQLSAGVRYSPIRESQGWSIRPFASGRLGHKWQALYNAFPAYTSQQSNGLWVGLGEVGLNVLIPGHLFTSNARYGCSISYQYTLPISQYNAPQLTGFDRHHLPIHSLQVGAFVQLDH